MPHRPRCLLLLLLCLGAARQAGAQLVWSSYNTGGTRVSASAAAFNSSTGNYTFTIPANTTYTLVTTGFVPVTLGPGQTKTVAFTMNAGGGFGPSGTPVQNQRFIAFGLFNYGATAPGATGSFTDDLGLWTDSYQQSSSIAAEVFGGSVSAANLLGYTSARQLGAGTGPGTGAIGQFADGTTTNVTFRVVEDGSGAATIGSGNSTAAAGAWYQDTATSGTVFNRTIYSGGTATPNGATTFNEFGFLFANTTGSAVTLTLGNFSGLTPIFTTQPPVSTVTTAGSGVTISAAAPTATAFQWEKSTDGGTTFASVAGATSATLSLTNVQSTDGGLYRLAATTADATYRSGNAVLTVFTANPNDPPVFVAFRTGQGSSGVTPTSAATATINAPGTGWAYSAAAQVTGTTWNQILRPNPLIGSGALNGTTGTFVCDSANAIGLSSATGAATNVKLTMNMVIADLESGSSTRVEPNTGAGGTTVLGPNGLMDNAWRIYRAGNTSTATLTGLTPGAHYFLYVYGSTTGATQGAKFTLNPDNVGSDDVASKSTAGGNSGNIFSTDGTNYSLTAAGTTWQQFHSVSNSSGNLVIASGLNSGNGQYYNGLQLVPYPLPSISAQPPASTTGITNGSVSLAVTATTSAGTPAFQWQRSTDNGVTFNNIDPYGSNASAGTATLTLTNLQTSDAGLYRVLVTNAGGTVISSNAALTVNVGVTAPSITTPPANATVLAGAGVTFNVVAGGTAPLTYQWARSTDGGTTYTDVSGATATSYSITSTALSDAGSYRVTVTNSAGSATSTGAVLAVQQAPAITTPPVASTVAANGSYTLTVAVTGTPAPTFQWTLNGANIAGATSASYVISNAAGANAGYYACVVTNAAGTVTTTPVYVGVLSSTLSLSALAPASGAAGLNRDTLLNLTFNQPVSVGNAGRIRVYDAANPATPVDTIDMSTAISVTQFGTTYRYMTRTVGSVNFNAMPVLVSGSTATIALHSSTVLAYNKTYYVNIEPGVLTDATGATFGGISDSTTWSFTTKATGPVATAAAISIAADGSGDFCTVQGAVDFIPYSPANTTPRTVTIANGTYNEIVRLRTGQNLVTMQGQSQAGTVIQYLTNNNTLISGANSIGQRSVFGADPNDFTIQNLTIRNTTPDGGSQAETFWVGNNAQRMTVNALNILSYQDTVMTNGGQTFFTNCYIEGNVDFIWGSGLTFFNNCELKMVGLAAGGFYVQARNTPSTFPGYFFYNCQLTRDASVTANSTYLARIDPGVSGGFPYSQVVWMNCRMGPHIIASGWQLNNAVTAPTVKLWEYQTVALDGTTPVSIAGRPTFNNAATGVGGSTVLNNQQIDSATAAYLSNAINAIGWSPAPVIGTQPAAQTVNVGQSVTFGVAATSPLALSYQWYKDGTPVSGAMGSSYTIASPSAADWAGYSVVITNPAGSVTSSGAALTINDPLALWASSFGLNPATTGARTADPDGDGVSNLVEFAFGMNPTMNSGATFTLSGTNLTSHGMPAMNVDAGGNRTARFVRRKTYASDGLIYTPQFSADLVTWQDSTDTPSVVASDATHEVVEVPFPPVLAGAQAGFFRMVMNQTP